MWIALLGWFNGHTLREKLTSIAVLVLGLWLAYFVFIHQVNVGFDKCEARHDAANAEAQTRADKVAAPANAQLHADLEMLSQPLPGYLQIYGDKSRPADCPSVQYVRKLKP